MTLLPGSGTAPHRSEQVEVEHPFPVGIVRVLKAGVLHRIRLERWELNLSRDTRRSDRVCLQDHDVAARVLCELGGGLAPGCDGGWSDADSSALQIRDVLRVPLFQDEAIQHVLQRCMGQGRLDEWAAAIHLR